MGNIAVVVRSFGEYFKCLFFLSKSATFLAPHMLASLA